MKNFVFGLIVLSVLIFSSGCSDNNPEVTQATNYQEVDNNPKPEGTDAICAPPNLFLNKSINKQFCGTDDCLINFAGYWWWTNYQFTGPPNWFWNQGSAWSPRNAWVDGEGLHLTVRKDDLGGGLEWMSAEVVAVYHSDKTTLATTQYGTYLVSARVKSAPNSWSQIDKNVAFGLFTYEPQPTGSTYNPNRELDLAEISRWGTPPCSNALDPRLCIGNAQFAVQIWDKRQDNVQRYTVSDVAEVTLVMHWHNANTPVEFAQYNGIYTLDNLPARPDNHYTTIAEQNIFIPDVDCQLFHMNLWMGNFGQGKKHPGPSNGQPQEVVVTNFQYRP